MDIHSNTFGYFCLNSVRDFPTLNHQNIADGWTISSLAISEWLTPVFSMGILMSTGTIIFAIWLIIMV